MSLLAMLFFGLLAGFLGTVILTLSQLIEIKFTKRESSFTPAIISSKLLGIKFDDLRPKQKAALGYATHFGYGILLGLLAPLLFSLIQSLALVVISQSLIVWLQGLVVVPVLGSTPPPWKWGIKWVLIDAFHHFVLGASTALIYFLII